MTHGNDGEPRESVSVSLPVSLIETLDDTIAETPDWLRLNRSELLDYVTQAGVEHADGDVLDLVPDGVLSKYRTKRRDENVQAKKYVVDKRAGWRGRVGDRLNARLAGEHPYHPEDVAALAEGYREELHYLHKLSPFSARTLDEDDAWLDQQIEGYRDAHHAKSIVPDSRPFEGRDDKVSLGRDLESLRGDLGALVDDLGERAESDAYDPDAIIRALAQDYAVDEEAVETVLDVLVDDDTDPRAALKSLDDDETTVADVLPDRAVSDVADPDPLDDAERVEDDRDGEYDLDAQTPQIDLGTLPTEETDDDVDPEQVEAIVEETIRADGGASDD